MSTLRCGLGETWVWCLAQGLFSWQIQRYSLSSQQWLSKATVTEFRQATFYLLVHKMIPFNLYVAPVSTCLVYSHYFLVVRKCCHSNFWQINHNKMSSIHLFSVRNSVVVLADSERNKVSKESFFLTIASPDGFQGISRPDGICSWVPSEASSQWTPPLLQFAEKLEQNLAVFVTAGSISSTLI